MELKIEALNNHPAAIPVAAKWHFAEWGHTDPGGSLESWTAAMAQDAGSSGIPGKLIALAGNRPVGVVGLVQTDMPGYEPAAGLAPWIKGLYVEAEARRQGIGALLVRRCEAWAAALGHGDLYLYTERDSPAQALYESLGWQIVRTGRYEDIDVMIMRTSLSGAGALELADYDSAGY
jgi:GNAT superfamily N-acetyltransferase